MAWIWVEDKIAVGAFGHATDKRVSYSCVEHTSADIADIADNSG